MFFKIAASILPLLVVAQGMGAHASTIGARNSSGGGKPSAIPVPADKVGHGAETAKPVSSAHLVPTTGKDLASSVSAPIKPMTTPTSANTGFEALALSTGPLFLFCPVNDCQTGCGVFPLSSLVPGQCFNMIGNIRSAAVLSFADVVPNVEVFIGDENCDDAVQLDVTDTCFNMNLNGGPADFRSVFTLIEESA